jgi:hypothetical protein
MVKSTRLRQSAESRSWRVLRLEEEGAARPIVQGRKRGLPPPSRLWARSRPSSIRPRREYPMLRGTGGQASPRFPCAQMELALHQERAGVLQPSGKAEARVPLRRRAARAQGLPGGGRGRNGPSMDSPALLFRRARRLPSPFISIETQRPTAADTMRQARPSICPGAQGGFGPYPSHGAGLGDGSFIG